MSGGANAASGGSIDLRQLRIQFGAGKAAIEALAGIDLTIAPGQLVSVLGPSGCGKSTIIGAVAGFVAPSAGEVRVDGQRVGGPGSDRGVVFQQHTLFPWKTAAANVEFGLKMRGAGRRERQDAARRMLALVGLAEFADHYPHQLSGGMQQRVNLARVLVNRPRVILMDEPFCALDAQTRLHMQQLLLGLWEQFGMTIVFVTHDVDEAVFLSDRVVVLTERPGRIQTQIPIDLPRPRTHDLLTSAGFVARKREILDLVLTRPAHRARDLAPPEAVAPVLLATEQELPT
jgi:NitT/TauT family transport system ATP-binding protein